MPATTTTTDLTAAANQLANSRVGRNALRTVLAWLYDQQSLSGDGLALDVDNQAAVLTLLEGAWGQYAGTARDAMREALGE